MSSAITESTIGELFYNEMKMECNKLIRTIENLEIPALNLNLIQSRLNCWLKSDLSFSQNPPAIR